MPRIPKDRSFSNNPTHLRRANAHEELRASIDRILVNCPPTKTPPGGWPWSGLYAGPTSTAYLFLQIAPLYPDLKVHGKGLDEWSQAYLAAGRRHTQATTGKLDPSHCGIAQEWLARTMVTAVAQHDVSQVDELCKFVRVLTDADDDGSDEWLYGRAGYLYMLRRVKVAFADDKKVEPFIQSTIDKVVARILQTPKPWRWHGKNYLGAVHGTVGILTQLVLASPGCAAEVETILSEVLDKQYPSGNFPASLPAGSDKLVQMCHGAPGVVLSLESLRPHFPGLQSRIDEAVTKARRCIWDRGVLTKEPCLCHGISANALGFDDRAKMEHMLNFQSTEFLENAWKIRERGDVDSFHALYTGEAGRAWAWVVADKGLERKCIAYNDV